jgi:hypothetical protein
MPINFGQLPRETDASKRHDARSQHVRELAALLFVKQLVDIGEGLGHGLPQSLRAVPLHLGSRSEERLVEALALEGIREGAGPTTLVDLGLGAFDFEPFEDRAELLGLRLLELELVSQKAQRSADAEAGAEVVATEAGPMTMTGPVTAEESAEPSASLFAGASTETSGTTKRLTIRACVARLLAASVR